MNGIRTTVFIDFIVNVDYKLLIEVLIDNEKKKTYYYRCLIKTIKYSTYDAFLMMTDIIVLDTHYVIMFINDWRQVGGVLRVLRFPPPIKLTTTI